MTIKDFARLCGCNPQTLRYYDRVDLLKPVKVDPWSGYRDYDKDQAMDFVKIRNLQRAGFSLEEIKGLLDEEDRAVYLAFEAKIREAEDRLREMKAIQASYLSEMSKMQERINEIKEEVFRSMGNFDAEEEFGISAERYQAITEQVKATFNSVDLSGFAGMDLLPWPEQAEPDTEKAVAALLRDPTYAVVFEKHGWEHVKEFFEDFCELEDGGEYAMAFRVREDRDVENSAFLNTLLTMLMERNEGKRKTVSGSVAASPDGENHFWLLKKRF